MSINPADLDGKLAQLGCSREDMGNAAGNVAVVAFQLANDRRLVKKHEQAAALCWIADALAELAAMCLGSDDLVGTPE